MQNDPELNGKYLGTITQDFVKVAKVLQEASYQMRVRKISDYPIFPIAKSEISIGQIFISSAQANLQWDYYISLLEEFIERNLIIDLDYFTENYKDADEFCCLFVVDTENNFHNFVFVPFPEEDSVILDE